MLRAHLRRGHIKGTLKERACLGHTKGEDMLRAHLRRGHVKGTLKARAC